MKNNLKDLVESIAGTMSAKEDPKGTDTLSDVKKAGWEEIKKSLATNGVPYGFGMKKDDFQALLGKYDNEIADDDLQVHDNGSVTFNERGFEKFQSFVSNMRDNQEAIDESLKDKFAQFARKVGTELSGGTFDAEIDSLGGMSKPLLKRNIETKTDDELLAIVNKAEYARGDRAKTVLSVANDIIRERRKAREAKNA